MPTGSVPTPVAVLPAANPPLELKFGCTETWGACAISILDARGVWVYACYDVTITEVRINSILIRPTPSPSTTYTQHIQRCKDFLEFQISFYCGGTLTVTGSATVNGRVIPISYVRTVPALPYLSPC